MGGEKSLSVSSVWSLTGSPPHGRGKVGLLSAGLHNLGITPAWAGKSNRSKQHRSSNEDHPRMGGEKALVSIAPNSILGSPPHGRGKD